MGIEYLFVVYLALIIAACFAAAVLERPAAQRRPLFQGVRLLLTRRAYLYFLLLILCVMIGSQTYNVFFSVYIHHLGGNVSERIGLLNTVSAVSELPFFILSGRLFKRYGYHPVLASAAFAGAIRWFVLSMEPSFPMLLASQMLHGITFALFYAAGVNYAYEMSPEGTKTTGQTIFSIVYLNLSNLIASNGGGWLIDHYGFGLMYQMVALTSVCGGIGFLMLNKYLRNKNELPYNASRDHKPLTGG